MRASSTVSLTITVGFKEKFKISEIFPSSVGIVRETKTLEFKGQIWFWGTPLGMWTLVDAPTFTSAKKLNQREKHDVSAEFFGACQGMQVQHDILLSLACNYFTWDISPMALMLNSWGDPSAYLLQEMVSTVWKHCAWLWVPDPSCFALTVYWI